MFIKTRINPLCCINTGFAHSGYPHFHSMVNYTYSIQIERTEKLVTAEFLIINPRRVCAARVTLLGLCVCVCLSVPFRPLQVKVSPENNTNASSRQDKDNKTGNFLFFKCSIQKLWCHLLTLSAFGGLVGLFSSS